MEYRWQIGTFDELGNHDLYALLRLRQEVFVVEQDCIFRDMDGLDQEAVHMLCWRSSELLAYLRCLKPGLGFAESSLGRIVVSPAGRGLQLGRELLQRGIDHNRQRWPDSAIQIGAQAYLEAFYKSLGFVPVGDEYIEDGIAHLHMIKSA
jgi:ElaA protein